MLLDSCLYLILSSCLVSAWVCEGDNCIVRATNEEGRCTIVHECEHAKKLLSENKQPQTCGFAGLIPLVCCPVKQEVITPKPAELNIGEKCSVRTTNEEGICKVQEDCRYDKKNITDLEVCGNIFGIPLVCCPFKELNQEKCDEYYAFTSQIAVDLGEPAKPKEFPHMAAVGYGNSKKEILWLCGGTLISHYFVLSAAHCVDSQEFGQAKWIRLGDLDLKNTTEDANPQDVKISNIYVHPKYQLSSHYHDIALLKMEKFIDFIEYSEPACLQRDNILPSNNVQATGWGKLGLFGDASSHLMKVNLSIVDRAICARRYADLVNSRKLRNGIMDETQICAGNAEGGDTCPGDSGGPLHYKLGKQVGMSAHFVVVGITSFGKGCGGENSAGVYTRVSAYVSWIENIVWRENIDKEQ